VNPLGGGAAVAGDGAGGGEENVAVGMGGLGVVGSGMTGPVGAVVSAEEVGPGSEMADKGGARPAVSRVSRQNDASPPVLRLLRVGAGRVGQESE